MPCNIQISESLYHIIRDNVSVGHSCMHLVSFIPWPNCYIWNHIQTWVVYNCKAVSIHKLSWWKRMDAWVVSRHIISYNISVCNIGFVLFVGNGDMYQLTWDYPINEGNIGWCVSKAVKTVVQQVQQPYFPKPYPLQKNVRRLCICSPTQDHPTRSFER